MNALWFAVACLAVLAACWLAGVKPLLDAGGYSESRRSWWTEIRKRGHAQYHVLGAALTFLVGVIVFRAGLDAAAAVTFVAWVLVEVAQRYPRRPYPHGKAGRFSGWDIVASALGIAIAWLPTALVIR